jgi:hypothetical protein
VYNLADKNAVRCEGGGHIAGAAVVAGGRPVSFSVPPRQETKSQPPLYVFRCVPRLETTSMPVSERSFLLKFSQPTAVVSQRKKFCHGATTVEINFIFCFCVFCVCASNSKLYSCSEGERQ